MTDERTAQQAAAGRRDSAPGAGASARTQAADPTQARGRTAGQPPAEGPRPTQDPTRERPSGSGGRAAARAQRRPVRRRVMVRKVDPWSVLKLSLVFYFSMLVVVMLGLGVFWVTIERLGVIETLLAFLAELQFDVQINTGNLFRAAFLVGLLNVVLWSGINVFGALLYNLVADVMGGLRLTLAEDE